MNTITKTFYRVNWSVSDTGSTTDPKIYNNLADAAKEASKPNGYWGSTGTVVEQSITFDKDTFDILDLSKENLLFY